MAGDGHSARLPIANPLFCTPASHSSRSSLIATCCRKVLVIKGGADCVTPFLFGCPVYRVTWRAAPLHHSSIHPLLKTWRLRTQVPGQTPLRLFPHRMRAGRIRHRRCRLAVWRVVKLQPPCQQMSHPHPHRRPFQSPHEKQGALHGASGGLASRSCVTILKA